MDFDKEVVSSVSNSKVKFAFSLRSGKNRSKYGCFLIEGFREISRYLCSTVESTKKGSFLYEPLVRLFVCEELLIGENNQQLIKTAESQGTKITYVSSYVFSSKLSCRDRPDGLLGVSRIVYRSLNDLKLSKNPMICILDCIEKPGNMGAILRCADSAGFDAVIVADQVTDLWNPRTVRSSVGSLFCVDCLRANCDETLGFLRERDIPVVVTSPYGSTRVDKYNWDGPFALVLGSEHFGISKFWQDNADYSVFLPMFGVCDSLNVATSASVFFYFARLRRENFGSKID